MSSTKSGASSNDNFIDEKLERVCVKTNGVIQTYRYGKLHSFDDTPAVYVESTGYWAYYENGVRHRKNGPAVRTASGEYYWSHHGVDFIESQSLETILKKNGPPMLIFKKMIQEEP